MNLYIEAKRLVYEAAVGVASGRRGEVTELVYKALKKAQTEAQGGLIELEAEVAKLRKVLAYHYFPSDDEWTYWYKHCDEISACGGCPPAVEEWKTDLALSHDERTAS